jgi:tight adherence protein B
LNKFGLQLEAAGLAKYGPLRALLTISTISILLASWIQLSFGIVGLSLSVFFMSLGFCFEAISARARARGRALMNLWPEITDSLQSAAVSGISLLDALSELARSGPSLVRPKFQELVQRIDTGEDFEKSISWLKGEFGNIHADRLLETILLVHSAGGTSYPSILRKQSKQLREDLATRGELESKKGWVMGTAKLSLVAPWFIVSTLAARPENSEIFNSTEGFSVLLIGLGVSVIAYRLISILGKIPEPHRVFLS